MSARHAAAVQESAAITRVQWRLMKKAGSAMIDLNRVLRILNARRIRFVLTGAHAIGGWTGQPRATKDVDILVKAGRSHARAVKALGEAFPQLEVRTFSGLTAFFVRGDTQSVIDVAYPHRADIEETLAHPIWVEDAGMRYRIPSLESALANKYGAMLTLSRDPVKRMQDATDFAKMVQHASEAGQRPIDADRLRELGEMVWQAGGGDEVLGLVALVQRGEVLNLNAVFGTPGA